MWDSIEPVVKLQEDLRKKVSGGDGKFYAKNYLKSKN